MPSVIFDKPVGQLLEDIDRQTPAPMALTVKAVEAAVSKLSWSPVRMLPEGWQVKTSGWDGCVYVKQNAKWIARATDDLVITFRLNISWITRVYFGQTDAFYETVSRLSDALVAPVAFQPAKKIVRVKIPLGARLGSCSDTNPQPYLAAEEVLGYEDEACSLQEAEEAKLRRQLEDLFAG